VLDDRIDVGRIVLMAEAFKRENMMFNTDDGRYRSIEF
jgi:hypothetical protein